jgi:hypothetical protein
MTTIKTKMLNDSSSHVSVQTKFPPLVSNKKPSNEEGQFDKGMVDLKNYKTSEPKTLELIAHFHH